MDKISVIVPVYKVEKYLRRCIESIINQTYTELEIILVDDGSPDSCGEICDEYAAKDSRIKVIHKENGGLSDARNAGIDAASGEYLAFADSDDFIAPDMYKRLYEAIKEADADMSLCSFVYTDDALHEIKQSFESPIESTVLTGRDILFEKLQSSAYWYWVVAWNKLYRRELFEGLRYPVGKLHEDEFMINDILLRCDRVACVDDALYYYVQRDDSITGKRKDVRTFDAVEAYFDRAEVLVENGHTDMYGALSKYMKSFYRRCCICCGQEGYRKRYRELTKRYRNIVRKISLKDMSLNKRIHICLWYISPYGAKRIGGLCTKVKSKIKRCIGYARFAVKVRKYNTLLIDTPIHANLGDHAIVMAERQFIEGSRQSICNSELTAKDINGKEGKYAKLIPKSCRILIHGGGFLGCLWPKEEYRFRRILKEFSKHTLVVFPQTVTFDMISDEGIAFFEESKKAYSMHKDLTLFVRERKSYDFMKENMPEVRCILVPDIVTILDVNIKASDRHGAIMLMRSDLEKNISETEYKHIYELCKARFSGDVFATDTVVDHNIDPRDRATEVNEKLKQFAGAKLVVTDRLHGMIFAAITSTPCIAMGNINGKVKGVYEWIKDNRFIRYIDDVERFEAELESIDLDMRYEYKKDDIVNKFKPLSEVIYEKR